MKPIPAYPLQWPTGWPRTDSRKYGKFGTREGSSDGGYRMKRDVTVAEAVCRVREQLRKLVKSDADCVISTDLALRLDGLPRSDQKAPKDPGAAVYWIDRNGHTQCMAIDRYTLVADNLAAIAATLQAMRAIERHGGAEILDRAFTGFAALPEPGDSEHWRDVLGVPDVGLKSAQADQAKAAYRKLASEHHPDKGGDADQMARINAAWADAQRDLQP